MKKLVIAGSVAALAVLAVVATSAFADRGGSAGGFRTQLSGYQELLSPTQGAVSTRGHGTFQARLEDGTLRYRLSYSDLEGGAVLQSHIHFGQRHTIGGVSAFLCDQAANDIPNCPTSGVVEGVVEPADVIGPAAQGIAAGEFEELVRAMRAGATYVNVHTETYPAGEIRGQLHRGLGWGFGKSRR